MRRKITVAPAGTRLVVFVTLLAVPALTRGAPIDALVDAPTDASVAAATAVSIGPDQDADLADPMNRGRACTEWFYGQEFDKIEALGVSEEMAAALQPLGGFSGFYDTVSGQLGAETEVVDESVMNREGLDAYVRVARFEKFAGDIVVQWVFDANGVVAGFAIRPQQ